MTFVKTVVKQPTSIGSITITLQDPDGQNVNRSIAAHVEVLDQDGEVISTWRGDLQPHLTPTQITSLTNFIDNLRIQAAAELLP